jgi:hypothetical protein
MTTAAGRRTAQNHGALKNGNGTGSGSVFDLDAYQAEAMREPFTFTLSGRRFTMPHLSDIDWHASLDDDGNPGVPTVHKMLRKGLGDQWDAFDRCALSGAGYNKLWETWQEHSGLDLGEDSASPPS